MNTMPTLGITMYTTILAALFEISRTALAMCFAGFVLFLIAVSATKSEISQVHGQDKFAALSNLCFAVPLAVFGAEHFFSAQSILNIVPEYMPWRLFWVYFVGCALIAAALSIATKVGVRWSGLLFGLMMFSFVAMIHLPGALHAHNRILWVIVFRESLFGGGGWILAGNATDGWRWRGKGVLITVGRIWIALALIFFGFEHFLYPVALPGVPLAKEMPTWIQTRMLIDYVTGSALLAAGTCILSDRKTQTAATWLGAWILLLVLVIYGPVLIAALANSDNAAKVEGINYFADTLLFAGAILALANATARQAVRSNPALT